MKSLMVGLLLLLSFSLGRGQFLEKISPICSEERGGTGLSIMLVTYNALQLLDLGTTYYGLARGAEESNYLMRSPVQKPLLMAGMKISIILGTNYVMKELYVKEPFITYLFMSLLNGLYGYVVYNNIGVLINL